MVIDILSLFLYKINNSCYMKKWFLAACLPLMIVSCDIFGLGDDGDDDDTMIVDPPMANVSFDYEDKILSGDTLVLTTYVRLVDPEVLFNNMPMEIEDR